MPYETNLKSHHGDKHVSSSENEGVGAQTPEGSHKVSCKWFVGQSLFN